MALSDILGGIKSGVEGAVSGINWADLISAATSAEAAIPAIEQGIVNGAPYVQAIVTILGGGTPTDADWDALDAHLDAGTAALQKAANEPDGGTP